MARTPLFLVMMCIEFEVTAQISNSQAMLFEKFVRTLLEFWDRERGVTRKLGEESKFPLDLKLRALETMASHFFEKDQLVFSERDLLECISGLLTRVDPTAGPHKVVSEIEEKSGLLVSDRAGQYRFCHPLFHEFFVARHYYEKMRKSDAESERIGRLFWDLRFQNVIVFCRELLAGNAE
jgi:predicted NACHT family NTPase